MFVLNSRPLEDNGVIINCITRGNKCPGNKCPYQKTRTATNVETFNTSVVNCQVLKLIFNTAGKNSTKL